MRILLYPGALGPGKGTLCKRLAEDFGFSHLSVGDVLRQVVQSADVEEAMVSSIRSGELVPVEALAPTLKCQLDMAIHNGQRKILVDGFPRRLDQAASVEALVGSP